MPKRPPEKPLWIKIVAGCAYAVLCVGALAVGSVSGWLGTSKTLPSLPELISPKKPQDVFDNKGQMIVLILGCDEDRTTGGASITNDAARSDMIMLAKLDFDNDTISGVSIPRDTLCGFDGYRERKINAYHAKGGNELAKRAVEALLPGVHVDRVVNLNYEGFVEMVNLVGGVPIDVEKNLNYDDNAGHLHIHLAKGEQLLDGTKALGYVRMRHSDSDFARQDRQHHFIMAFKDALAKNIGALPQVIDGAAKMVADGFNGDEVYTLGRWVKDVPKDHIKFGAIPVYDVANYNERVSQDKLPGVLAEYGFLATSRPVASR